MQISEKSKKYYNKIFENSNHKLVDTDPEFTEIFCNFAFDEVVNQDDLDDRIRFIAIIATLIGCQGIDSFKEIAPVALDLGVTPIEIKEIIYQATAYLGIGRVLPFLYAINEILENKGIKLPLDLDLKILYTLIVGLQIIALGTIILGMD